MMYVTPFGTLNPFVEHPEHTPVHYKFVERDKLNCGFIIQDGCEDGDATTALSVCGMGISYCETLAAAMFYGNAGALNTVSFSDDESALRSLADETIDVLVGLEANFTYDFEGVTFSMPYFYGHETGM
jgi:hypothetical protein